MVKKRQTTEGLMGLLNGEQVRRVEQNGQTRYAAADVAGALAEAPDPCQYWNDLLAREPELARVCEPAEFRNQDGAKETLDSVDLEGVFRLVQAIPSPRCEKVKAWLAQSGKRRIEEAENPELAALRARKLYEQKGYSRRWTDKRLRGISARHELTGEWYKRGATESEQFRALTNELMHSAFGMDVEGYRRYKNLIGAGQTLRDHMTDLELALTSLGETTAVALHQARDSQGFEKLAADTKDAGEIVAQTLAQIQRRGGRPVVTPANHRLSRPQIARGRAVAGDAVHGRPAGDRMPPTSPRRAEAV